MKKLKEVNDYTCTFCERAMISDEYHYMFECMNEDIVEWKRKFLKNYERIGCFL